jgi:Zn-dependent peptidase ImmA (M78 family)
LGLLARLYHRTIEFFLQDTPLVGDFVLWRCRPPNEEEAKSIERQFLALCEDYRDVEELTGETGGEQLPSEDTPRADIGFSQAVGLAAKTWADLALGPAPAEVLRHVLEERFRVKIFALPLASPASSLCTVSERFGYGILLNQRSMSWRRNYDLAHELFHLLTWRSFAHSESSQEADPEEEKLANSFASNLLLPEGSFWVKIREFLDANGGLRMTFADLHGLARAFDVSSEAVVYRLAGLLRWKKNRSLEIITQLREFYSPRESTPIDSLPERYMYLVTQAYRQGLLSFGKGVKLLRCNRKDAEEVLEPPDGGVDLNSAIEVAAS